MSSITSVSPRTLGGRDPRRPGPQHRPGGRRRHLGRADRPGGHPAALHPGTAVPADVRGAAGRRRPGQLARPGLDGAVPAGRDRRRAAGSPKATAAGNWPRIGYVVGFVAAAWLVGLLAERQADRTPSAAGRDGAGQPGDLRLRRRRAVDHDPFDLPTAIAKGVLPFLIGDAIKIVVAAALLPATWKRSTPAGEPSLSTARQRSRPRSWRPGRAGTRSSCPRRSRPASPPSARRCWPTSTAPSTAPG